MLDCLPAQDSISEHNPVMEHDSLWIAQQ
jgi:hypothetical protein